MILPNISSKYVHCYRVSLTLSVCCPRIVFLILYTLHVFNSHILSVIDLLSLVTKHTFHVFDYYAICSVIYLVMCSITPTPCVFLRFQNQFQALKYLVFKLFSSIQ